MCIYYILYIYIYIYIYIYTHTHTHTHIYIPTIENSRCSTPALSRALNLVATPSLACIHTANLLTLLLWQASYAHRTSESIRSLYFAELRVAPSGLPPTFYVPTCIVHVTPKVTRSFVRTYLYIHVYARWSKRCSTTKSLGGVLLDSLEHRLSIANIINTPDRFIYTFSYIETFSRVKHQRSSVLDSL